MVALIAAALTANTDPVAVKWLIIAGLIGGLVGDVALLPRFDRFLAGLGAFLVGHAFYVAAFLAAGVETAALVTGLCSAAALGLAFGRPIIGAVAESRLLVPVALYILTIGAMVVVGVGTRQPGFLIGAVLFALSDSLLGTDRFVTPRPDRRIIVHALYHSAQILFVAAIL